MKLLRLCRDKKVAANLLPVFLRTSPYFSVFLRTYPYLSVLIRTIFSLTKKRLLQIFFATAVELNDQLFFIQIIGIRFGGDIQFLITDMTAQIENIGHRRMITDFIRPILGNITPDRAVGVVASNYSTLIHAGFAFVGNKPVV